MDDHEAGWIRNALESAGLFGYALDESGPSPVATLDVALADGVDVLRFAVDAPSGWMRLSTTLPAGDKDPAQARQTLHLLYGQTGWGHVQYDPSTKSYRIGMSLQAVSRPPRSEALVAAMQHLRGIRRKLATGEGDVRALQGPARSSDDPTLAEAGAALGEGISLALQPDGTFAGGLREPRSGAQCAVRLHSPSPGIFALDAWRLPPRRGAVDVAALERIDTFNASLDAGAMMLFPDGFLVYRWACPYRWLAVDELTKPVSAYVALDAFLRLGN